MSVIQIFCLKPVSALKQRRALRSFLEKTASQKKRPIGSLNLIFCDDDHLLQINKDFLHHDYYTDIITFDLSVSTKSPFDAEIYISIDRVKENARMHGSTYSTELHRVIFHGLLHLLGYHDKTPKEKALMRKTEDQLLKAYLGPHSI